MQPKQPPSNAWRRGQRRTLWIAFLTLALWAFLIYWQGEVSLSGFTGALFAIFTFNFNAIPAPYGSLFLDLFLLLAGGAFWMLFFAHFVVPLRQPGEALDVLKGMGRALLGQRPSAVYLRHGRPVDARSASDPPRILLLDSASAAVLRNDTAFTRAIGPGLSFARPGEQLAGTLDLRVQRRALGPRPDEDPFAPRGLNEERASQHARQQRRQETSGLTRDGVEVVPRIEVDFRVEGRARKGSGPYPFQAEFAWRAVASEGVAPQSPSDTRAHQVSWDWLPVHLAVDVWREYLRKFSLQELFERHSPTKNSNGNQAASGLEQLQQLINLRLRQALVPEAPGSSRTASSPEYQLLRGRGLRVLDVRLRELHLDASRDETRLVNEWSETWELRAIEANAESSRRSREKERLGQQAAAAEFVRHVSGGLYERLLQSQPEKGPAPDEAESLTLLLDGSLHGAARLPGLRAEVGERLEALAAWLKGATRG